MTNEYVFFGGKRVAMDVISSGSISSTYYYAEDFLGSSRSMVQAGQTSACFDADFLPFGREKDNIATCTQNDYKFEGKERDAETGNDDFGARYYSSNFGRWLSPDWSSTPEPVPYANLTNPQTLNLYAMVQDNPESFADLDGHVIPSASADIYGTCNVTNGNGCDDNEQSLLIHVPANVGPSPQKIADWINSVGSLGDPYALTYTPFKFWERVANLIIGNGWKTMADIVEEQREWLASMHVSQVGPDGKVASIDWSKKSSAEVSASYDYMQRIMFSAHMNHLESLVGIAATVTMGHGARHLAGTGLSQSDVETAIRQDVEQGVKNATEPTGSFWGRVKVGGQTIEYRAYTMPDGTINVGTYYVP